MSLLSTMDRGLWTTVLSPEEVEQQGEDDADNNTGGEGKIKAEVFPLNRNVPRKPSYPGDFQSGVHQYSNDNEEDTHYNEHLPH